jgi:type IV secretion system protein TrbL
VIVLLAFFILAIHLFVTLIEFKLTTLAGFVLIPFGLFGKTAFAAERVLGNVISSGVKVMVLAVIVGIGSTLFSQVTAGSGGAQIGIEDAMALVLAALALLGLGIFGPGIASGIVSGGPQLGAGAAVGTGLAAGGVVVAGAGLAAGSAGALAGAARGTTTLAGSASGAFRTGGVSGTSAMTNSLRRAAASPGSSSASTGGAAAGEAGAAQTPASSSADTQSGWAKRMRSMQTMRHGASAAANTVRSADQNGGGGSVDLSEGKQ